MVDSATSPHSSPSATDDPVRTEPATSHLRFAGSLPGLIVRTLLRSIGRTATNPSIFPMLQNFLRTRQRPWCAITVAVSAVLGGCAAVPEAPGALRKEMVYAVTATNKLVSFNAGRPGKLLSQLELSGLQAKETVLGIDYRVAKGWLYAIGSSGRLYRVETATGALQMIGNGAFAIAPSGTEFGMDFNPTVDRIRFVSNTGQNLRLHPDTGAVVDSDANTAGLQPDGRLAYATGDVHAGQTPAVAAAAYTYNKDDDNITTNFVIDALHGTLATQGTREGKTPAISPNTGQLFTVGALGIGKVEKVSFDIADLSGSAFIAAAQPGGTSSSWYEVDLENGKARRLGEIGIAEPVVGIAVAP